jgi:pSer/pThr/pTyr-binding forkhead associated (FHA) protein
VPPLVLTVLKLLFLVLLYLFIARAVRIVYLDMVGPKVPKTAAQQQAKRRSFGTPKMVSVQEPGVPLRSFSLEGELTVGKQGTTITLADSFVSTKHARIYQTDQGWLIEDMGSTNGTFVNKVKVVAPTPLKVGDEIRLGKTTIEVKRG